MGIEWSKIVLTICNFPKLLKDFFFEDRTLKNINFDQFPQPCPTILSVDEGNGELFFHLVGRLVGVLISKSINPQVQSSSVSSQFFRCCLFLCHLSLWVGHRIFRNLPARHTESEGTLAWNGELHDQNTTVVIYWDALCVEPFFPRDVLFRRRLEIGPFWGCGDGANKPWNRSA